MITHRWEGGEGERLMHRKGLSAAGVVTREGKGVVQVRRGSKEVGGIKGKRKGGNDV